MCGGRVHFTAAQVVLLRVEQQVNVVHASSCVPWHLNVFPAASLSRSLLLQVVRRAATSLGYICRGHASSAVVLAPAVDALLGLRTNKSEEVLFSAGEALCFAFGGGPPLGCCWASLSYSWAGWLECGSGLLGYGPGCSCRKALTALLSALFLCQLNLKSHHHPSLAVPALYGNGIPDVPCAHTPFRQAYK